MTATRAPGASERSGSKGSRGSLVVASEVVEKVAAEVAARTDGVGVPHSSALRRVRGGQTPGVRATVVDGIADLQVEVTLRYPDPVERTCRALRDALADQVPRLSGVELRLVDITVVDLVPDSSEARPTAASGAVEEPRPGKKGRHVAPTLLRRPARIVPVAALGVLAVGLGLAALVAGLQRVQHGVLPGWFAGPLHRLSRGSALTWSSWDSRWAWAGFVLLAVVAVVCLAGCVLPGGANGVRLSTGEAGQAGGSREIFMADADLEGLVERWIRGHDGVRGVRVRRRGRRLVASVRTTVASPDLLREALARGCEDLVYSLGLARPMGVRLRLR